MQLERFCAHSYVIIFIADAHISYDYKGLHAMIKLPRLEGKNWDRLSRRLYEYAIEVEERKGPCTLEQALEWARQKAGETGRPVRLAVLWDGEWRLVDIICPSEYLAWSHPNQRVHRAPAGA